MKKCINHDDGSQSRDVSEYEIYMQWWWWCVRGSRMMMSQWDRVTGLLMLMWHLGSEVNVTGDNAKWTEGKES